MSGKNFLTDNYNDNLIGIFPQGPKTAFVYWELSVSQQETLADLEGFYVRLYKVCENENFDYDYQLVSEIIPPASTNKWYFNQLEPGSMYVTDIGCKLPGGSFFSLVKSGRITTPPEPKTDFMPKQKAVEQKTAAPFMEILSAGGKEGITETGLKTTDVFRSMPFYMGYHIS